MQQTGAFEPNTQNENSYVFLQIVPEGRAHASNQLACTQEITQKLLPVNEFQPLAPNFPDSEILSQAFVCNNKISKKPSVCDTGIGSINVGINSSSAHLEIIHNSQHNASKHNASKVEGRKAPGSNRILPLITSVWEDGDLLRKRQKSPKGSKRDNKGNGARSKRKVGQESFDIDEVSDEEEWFQYVDKDCDGGGIHMAYADFFMDEEGGEDREDCICRECGAEFLTATQVVHHLEHHHHKTGIKLHQCFVCRRKRYPSLTQLNQHLSKAHGIPRPELTCRTCFMELAGESEAKAHSRKHQTPYICSRCSLSHSQMGYHPSIPRFSTRFLLAEHLREVHLPRERPHSCSICGRHFLHRFVRDLHVSQRHHGLSLTCPEAQKHLSFSPPKQISLKGSDCSIKPSVLPVSSSPTESATNGIEGFKRIDFYVEGGYTDHQVRHLNGVHDGSVHFPIHLQTAMHTRCSMGSFLFPNEVSLLRHIYQSHDKSTRVQLLKSAREMDCEDSVFEELWKAYLNYSSKRNLGGMILTENGNSSIVFQEKTSEVGIPMQSELPSNDREVSSKNLRGIDASATTGNHLGFVKCSSLLLPSDITSTSPTVTSINRSVVSSDGFTKVSLSNAVHVSQFESTTVFHSSSNSAHHDKGNLLKHLPGFPIAPSSGDVFSVLFDGRVTQQSVPESESSQGSSSVVTSHGSMVSTTKGTHGSELSEMVTACMMDVLDSVCSVMDKRFALKESKKPSAIGGIHKTASSVRCSLCRYLASNPMTLERHRRRRHFRNRHCPFCSLACPSVDSVWRHVSEKHLSVTKKQSKAEENSPTVDTEVQNQSQKLAQSLSGLRCPLCKKVFLSKGKCNSHQETVHKVEVVSRPLSCDICSKKYLFKKALERHKILHSRNEESSSATGPIKCPHCEQTFLRPGFLERHVATHFEHMQNVRNGENMVESSTLGHLCPSCPRRLSTQAKLKAHLRTSHPPSHLKQRFRCSECPVRCNTASGLRIHARVHTGERPFPCQQCSATFKRHTALKKHVQALHPSSSSTSDKDARGNFLKCPTCSSSFRDRSNLVRHFLQVHRGLRRFVCGLCGSRYSQNQDLRRHLKVNHDMEAPGIIGSDRKSVDQIYVVPPLHESLPADHPLVDKIKLVVEEEEQKLNEDSLPQFRSSPQQVHLHIHKGNGQNAEPAMDEDRDDQACSFYSIGGTQEKGASDVWNASMSSHINESRGKVPVKTRKRSDKIKDSRDVVTCKKVASGATSKSSSKDDLFNKKVPIGSRNLILDALISSQISMDSSGSNAVPLEESTHLDHIFNETSSAIAGNTDNICHPAEVNIIMSHDPPTPGTHFMAENISCLDAGSMKSDVKTGRCKKYLQNKKTSSSSGDCFCNHCGKTFLDVSRLERHCKIHQDTKPHVCSLCGKSFVEKYNLKVHMRSHTGERPYKCEDCGKTMRYLKELTDHRRMHLGERPYGCKECSKAFLRLRDLQRHELIHTNEKKHKCPICGKAFSRLDHLRAVHMRVHKPRTMIDFKVPKKSVETSNVMHDQIGQKNIRITKVVNEKASNRMKEISQYKCYTCKKCSKQFSSKSKLNQHLVLHSGQKEHKCSTCGRSFALISYLRAHNNVHRKQEGYVQCPKCPRRFTSDDTLSVHEEKFHGRIERMKKFPSPESCGKAGKVKDLSVELCDEEKFFMARTADFDMNLDLEDEMNIQEVELFDSASLCEPERPNTFVYLHVISDQLQLASETGLIE